MSRRSLKQPVLARCKRFLETLFFGPGCAFGHEGLKTFFSQMVVQQREQFVRIDAQKCISWQWSAFVLPAKPKRRPARSKS